MNRRKVTVWGMLALLERARELVEAEDCFDDLWRGLAVVEPQFRDWSEIGGAA